MRVYDICGPTYPGEFDAKTRTYTLHYPGLAFLFPIPAQHAEACSENHIGMPLEFPDGSTPLASRICIYAASEGAQRVALFKDAAVQMNLSPIALCQSMDLANYNDRSILTTLSPCRQHTHIRAWLQPASGCTGAEADER